MKKQFRLVIILLALILIASTISASASSVNGWAAQQPWTDQLFKDAEDGVTNLSTAFVGAYQIPMLSYSRAGHDVIYAAHKATNALPGNCGLNNDWVCLAWSHPSLTLGTVSQMATYQYIDTHAIRWAYSTGSTIRGASIELMNDMTFVTENWQDLVQISKFGASLVGAPSLQIDSGGHYEMAVTILDSGDLYPYSLVYINYVGGSNTSCLDSGSPYQCDVIDTSLGFGSMGAPSFDIADDGAVGIAYYKNGEMMYAYPHLDIPGWPSNCGPGGDTWRCISIFSGTPTGTVGNVAKLALGQNSSQRGIAFTYDDELIPVTLYHADYVGSGGNCGWDGSFGGYVNKWHCEDLVYFYYQSSASFSLEIDPEGYSVIAYDYTSDDLANRDLYIVYPNARIGDPDPGWTAQHIDGAPVYDVETGALAALSIRDDGTGFIGYLQEEAYEVDDLKIAFQTYRAMLPVVSKP